MASTNGANNARVTNAILSTKMDAVIDKLDDALEAGKGRDKRITNLEIEQGKLSERLKFRTIAHGMVEAVTAGLSIVGLVNR